MKLTIHEIAQSLYLPLGTVRRWIRQGRIPIHKSGSGYVFNEAILSKWATAHNLNFSPPQKDPKRHRDSELVSLSLAMQRGGMFYDVKGKDIVSSLKEAVEHVNTLTSLSKEKLLQGLLERENLTSTGIGKGIAIPHPHKPLQGPEFDPFITTCFLARPIDFAALDGKPVFVMFILLCPSVKSHLHLLSRLAFCIRDDSFVSFLKTYPNEDSMLMKIADFEKQLDQTDQN
jgi:PTS system nitrogen regulatory IIA component